VKVQIADLKQVSLARSNRLRENPSHPAVVSMLLQDAIYRFGPYELRARTREVYKDGIRLKVRPQPFQVLLALVARSGDIVTRGELQRLLWPAETFLDFEHGLNTAIKELRGLLNDSANEARYIETLPKLGYRVIVPVTRAEPVHAAREREEDASTPAASVAVLPFANLSADPENEFFADGITEDVITHLAKIKSLKVISRTSVMMFKKRDCGLREIGERLGALTLLEGSVRRTGSRVRIVAQLVDGATDEHIWAETYDRDLTDIFAIQTDVAMKIATALRAELSHDERSRVGRRPTDDLAAYELYLRGRNWFHQFTEGGYRRSLLDYHAAVDRDPGFALAWVGIAGAYAELCIGGSAGESPEETIVLAKKAARRALEIDPELGEAHSISALIQFAFDFDWADAERSFLRAIELSPGSAQAHQHYGWLCSSLGRHDDALRQLRRARELDPLLIPTDVVTHLLRAGRIGEALEEARKSAWEQPGTPRCHSVLGWALIFSGEETAGIASLERAVALSPGATLFLSQLGQAWALKGDVKRARQILDEMRDRSTREFVSPYHFAYVYAGLGEADAAIDCLERAFERRSGAIYGIKGSFLFRNLRDHPRFESLLRRMNLS
jgi:adenylate cyclase